MAKQEHDREDLLREATALVERAEFTIDGYDDPIVVGFRRDGSPSAFLGVDPVYQFNKHNELRRAYRNGSLFKAEGGRLVRLQRNRTAKATELIRHELTDAEQQAFLDELVTRITELRNRLGLGGFQLIGQVPTTTSVMDRIQKWLDKLSLPPSPASSPRVE